MIAAYQRISRADGDLGKDGKDKSNSIENQKELIQRYISCKESLQNVPVMDFVDDGYTGSNFDRPGFQQMMDGVRSGKIDTIIVKDLSRFGRDYIGVGEYMEQIFPLLGVRLIAINDNYDSNNYKGTTLGMDVVVSNLVNTMYCRDAGKKLRTANRVKWRKGISTASSAPFGYQFDPNKKGSYIIDPPAAKIVRRIFDLAILGLRTREIAMTLNDENAPVPSVYNREHKAYGKETTYTIAPVILWDSTRVWKILTAYVYTGAMVLGKSQRLISGKSISRTVPKGQQYITEGTHEAIVSREQYNAVKAEMARRSALRSPSKTALTGRSCYTSKYALSDRLVCGECGTLYRRCTWTSLGRKYPVWRCTSRLNYGTKYCHDSPTIKEEPLQAAILTAINSAMSDKPALLDLIKNAVSLELLPVQGQTMSLADIERRLAQLDEQFQQLLTEAIDAEDKEACNAQFAEILAEQTSLKKQKETILQSSMDTDRVCTRMKQAEQAIENTAQTITEWNENAVRQIVERVTVLSADEILVRIKGGAEIKQRLERK